MSCESLLAAGPTPFLLPHDADDMLPRSRDSHRCSDGLSKAGLQDFCDGFRLGKTGNKATLMDRLRKFSANRDEWDR